MPKFPSLARIEKLKSLSTFRSSLRKTGGFQASAYLYILRKVSPDCATKSRLADNIGT